MADYNPNFSSWMHSVDRLVADRCGGLTTTDLPDLCYLDMFLDGKTPKQAASKAVRAAKDEGYGY